MADIFNMIHKEGFVEAINWLIGEQGYVWANPDGSFSVKLSYKYFRSELEYNSWFFNNQAEDLVGTSNSYHIRKKAEELYCKENDWVRSKRFANVEELIKFVKKTFFIGRGSQVTG